MNITEKMVERALCIHSQEISLPISDDQSEYDFEFNAMRATLEAAFAAAEVIPGTDVFATAEKESDVMPPDPPVTGGSQSYSWHRSICSGSVGPSHTIPDTPGTWIATSPGGAITGASAAQRGSSILRGLQEAIDGDFVRVTIGGQTWIRQDAPPAPSPDEVEREREILREAQARRVMPMIGPLLDAWDGLPNDMRSDIKEIHPSLSEWLDHIISAMEEETNEMLDTGLEPLDEIDQDALTELQQRADAVLGDKSRFKVIDPPPFFLPDEVERADKALEKAMLPWKTIREVLERAGFAIAAMNRAVEPSYDDGQPYKDLLKDLVDLHSEEWALTGGGPGITERWEKAWVAAAELFEG